MELELGSYILGLLTFPVVALLGVGITRTVEQRTKERQAWESMTAAPKPSPWLMEQVRRASQQESEAEESVTIRQPWEKL